MNDATEDGFVPFVVEDVPCPVCKAERSSSIVPSLKFNEKIGTYIPHPEIRIAVCDNCGLVFENPQILVEESPAYSDTHYYNKLNPVLHHDIGQKMWNIFRWHATEHKLPWSKITKALDIGASGAWSNLILKNCPSAKSVLIEPSSEAIELCKQTYPEVQAEFGTFDQFHDTEGNYDLITSFYSLYTLPNPVEALEKVRRLLKPDGIFMICMSNLYLGLEIWTGKSPWLNYSQLNRAILLVYFSQNTLQKLLEASGFEIVEKFTFEFPRCHEWKGRQELYVIARPVQKPHIEDWTAFFTDENERAYATNFFKHYAEICTENSIKHFFEKTSVTEILLIQDGDTIYTEWVAKKIREMTNIELSGILDINDVEDIPDKKGLFVLCSGAHGVDTKILSGKMKFTKIIDCALPATDNYFGNYVTNDENIHIIARAFCPYIDDQVQLFPFTRAIADNDIFALAEDIEGYQELMAEQVASSNTEEETITHENEEPDWSNLIAQFCESLTPDIRKQLLIPYFMEASNDFLIQNPSINLGYLTNNYSVMAAQSLFSHVLSSITPDKVQDFLAQIAYFRDLQKLD